MVQLLFQSLMFVTESEPSLMFDGEPNRQSDDRCAAEHAQYYAVRFHSFALAHCAASYLLRQSCWQALTVNGSPRLVSLTFRGLWTLNAQGGVLTLSRVSSSPYRVRRATLDDIRQLTALWQTMQFPAEDLAKRVTEFQVALGADGNVLGAIGLQIAERQGLVHSEAFYDFALAEHLRPLLWDRLHAVATNHGLLRVWTREQAPFWNHCGLVKADAETLHKLPALWRGAPSPWLTLKLRDDVETVMSLDKEFALFMQSEKQRTERVFQHARMIKTVATLIAFALLIAVGIWAVRMFIRNPQLLHR